MAQSGNPVAEKPLQNNYQIRVDYTLNGKSSSFTIVTAQTNFTYEGLGKEDLVEGIRMPSPIKFEGQLSNETDAGIFLGFFLGRTVPYATSTYAPASTKGAPSYSSVQQLSVGIKNGTLFEFGKALKVVESDGEQITIRINRINTP